MDTLFCGANLELLILITIIPNIMSWIRIIPSLSAVILLVGCGTDHLKSDVSNIQVQIEFVNLDSLFVHTPKTAIESSNESWKKEFGEAYSYVLGQCIQIASPSDSVVASAVDLFRNEPYIAKLEKAIEREFYPIRKNKDKMDLAFKRLKFHLPTAKFPKRIFFSNTLFQSSVFTTTEDIVVGMERYLGPTHPLLQQLPPDIYFKWVIEGMDRKYLEADVLTSWVSTHIVPETKGNLAEEMIRWGKILVLVEAGLYDAPKEIVLRYSREDLQWAMGNEYSLWDYLKKEELLFVDSEREKMNMLKPGPFTIGLPEKGPDRLGQYLGWRMVHSFLEKNDVSLQTLIQTPYTKILQAYEID